MFVCCDVLLSGVTYLDHAGTTLYTDQQVVSTMKDLTANVYGNPHSRSDCSQRTTELVELVRARLALLLSLLPSVGQEWSSSAYVLKAYKSQVVAGV